MLKKLLALALAALLGCASALAEFPAFENQIPDEPMITENDAVSVTAQYDPEADRTLYTIAIRDGAKFPDGSPLTAEDLLFTWYVYLDPGYAGSAATAKLNIPGLESYRLQASEAQLHDVRALMNALEKAGPDHVWSESDPWTVEIQETYRSLKSAYDAACDAEYPKCVQAIVDLCRDELLTSGADVFGRPAAEVAENEGLCVAYAMMIWGYAVTEDGAQLTSTRTRTVWQLATDIYPTADDFVNELKAVYGNDLAACWAVECTGTYEPALPDFEGEFVKAAVQTEPVTSVAGVRMIDESTLEAELPGIDMRSEGALAGVPVLQKNHYGDAARWNPEAGLYGHAFGDVSAIESALAADNGAQTALLMEAVADDGFFHP